MIPATGPFAVHSIMDSSPRTLRCQRLSENESAVLLPAVHSPVSAARTIAVTNFDSKQQTSFTTNLSEQPEDIVRQHLQDWDRMLSQREDAAALRQGIRAANAVQHAEVIQKLTTTPTPSALRSPIPKRPASVHSALAHRQLLAHGSALTEPHRAGTAKSGARRGRTLVHAKPNSTHEASRLST